VSLLERRLEGTFEIDPWGLDVDLLRAVAPVAGLRWSFALEGDDLLADGPALLVAPRRLRAPSEAVVLAAAVWRGVGRPLRVLGIPDVAPIGPLLRRFGGVVDHPAEAASLLRAGHLVLARHGIDVQAGIPVIGVEARGWELGRRWMVRFTEMS
jgi:hypothetical protein